MEKVGQLVTIKRDEWDTVTRARERQRLTSRERVDVFCVLMLCHCMSLSCIPERV